MIGFYHPDHPGYGFQQVSGDLFDGRSERARLVRLVVRAQVEIALASSEDMIADRLGQHAVASASDRSRLEPARVLFQPAVQLDIAYRLKRIEDEGGDAALLDITS